MSEKVTFSITSTDSQFLQEFLVFIINVKVREGSTTITVQDIETHNSILDKADKDVAKNATLSRTSERLSDAGRISTRVGSWIVRGCVNSATTFEERSNGAV